MHLEIRNGRAGLESLLEQFQEFARLHNIPPQVQQDIHLALDEIVSNIATHGFTRGRQRHITVQWAIDRGVLQVEVVDDGPPFDPLREPEPRPDVPIVDRPIGGMGILLVKRLMDSVEYARRDDRNHLVMRRVIETT